MTRHLYELALEDHLRELIEEDPKEAYNQLSASPESSPDLYTIALHGNREDWPSQIVMCDQTQTLLNRIDFQKGQSLSLAPSELPSLADLAAIL